jgi:hypothetical protein
VLIDSWISIVLYAIAALALFGPIVWGLLNPESKVALRGDED